MSSHSDWQGARCFFKEEGVVKHQKNAHTEAQNGKDVRVSNKVTEISGYDHADEHEERPYHVRKRQDRDAAVVF